MRALLRKSTLLSAQVKVGECYVFINFTRARDPAPWWGGYAAEMDMAEKT
jgi:hypothetical protein